MLKKCDLFLKIEKKIVNSANKLHFREKKYREHKN